MAGNFIIGAFPLHLLLCKSMARSVPKIQATDEEIENALQQAHLPALVNALVHMTGSIDLLDSTITPTPGPAINPAESYPKEAREDLLRLAKQTLIQVRDTGLVDHELTDENIKQMMNFITGVEISDDYVPYALDELGITPKPVDPPLDSVASAKFHVAIVGAGMSGLLAAIKLKEAGIGFTVFEKNSDVGGTWFENRYPGCRVDSPNHTYSYSFKPNDWPQHFSNQPTLLKYFQDTADEFELRDGIAFETEVKELRYDSNTSLWSIEVQDSEGTRTVHANSVITAVGQLNRPKMPDIEGIEDFRGVSFHSANWDHDISLKGKKVAIIGTGASAFQFTPEVVKDAAEVSVFMRTPPWVAMNPTYHEYISDEVHWLLNTVPYYGDWFRFHMFWMSGEGLLSQARVEDSWNDKTKAVSAGNNQLREMLTHAMSTVLDDREDLIDKLTPWYPPAAKRMLIDNGHWYRSLKEDHVEVITTPIERIVENGIRSEDGNLVEVDVVIYGTGFRASKFLFPMEIYGADGQELRASWQDDPRAYLGISTPNYPNLFFMYGPNTNIVVNGSIIFFSECETHYIMKCLRHLIENNLASMECKEKPFLAYNEYIDEANLNMAWGASSVNAWYKNESGRVTQNWPGTLVEFWHQTRELNPDDYRFHAA